MHGISSEGVSSSHNGTDIEIVRPVFYRYFKTVASTLIEIFFDCFNAPVTVAIHHIATVSFVKEFFIILLTYWAWLIWMLFFP